MTLQDPAPSDAVADATDDGAASEEGKTGIPDEPDADDATSPDADASVETADPASDAGEAASNDESGVDADVDVARQDGEGAGEATVEESAAMTAVPAAAVAATTAPAAAAKKAAPAPANGWYTIKSLLNTKFALYVKGLKTADGTKIVLKKGVTSAGFAFKLKKVGKYYRVLVGISTKKSVEVIGKASAKGVVDIRKKNTKATLFKLVYDDALQGYRLVNAKTGQALAVSGGKAKANAKVVAKAQKAGAKAQTFALVSRPGLVATNIYSIRTVLKGKNALTADGSKAAYYGYIKDFDQKWYVAPVAGKKNVYIIESISTGKRLTGVKDKQAKVKAASATNKAQWWVPSFGGKGIVWKNYSTKKPLSTKGATCPEGSKAMNKKYADAASQQFKMKAVPAVETGIYELVSAANADLAMEVLEGSSSAGAKAQMGTRTGGNKQKWVYDAAGHTLLNVNSTLQLDAAAAAAAAEAAKAAADGEAADDADADATVAEAAIVSLTQQKKTGAAAQQWTIQYAGAGKFRVVSGAAGAPVATAVEAKDGAAATVAADTGANAQRWKLSNTLLTVKPKGFNLIKSIVNKGHGKLVADYICIHETANPGATALAHKNLWAGNGYYADYAVHYVLDWTGNCYYCVPENRLCWQVGGGNAHVIGIELCHATTKAQFTKVWNAGVQWAAWQLLKHGWGIDKLVSHDDCRKKWGGTDHTDPIGYFKEYGKTWSQFKAAVKKAMAAY